MKSKETVGIKKQSVAVNDLKTRKNPKGGGCVADTSTAEPQKHSYKGIVTLVK